MIARSLRHARGFSSRGVLLGLSLLVGVSRADAHPAPFSFLDLLIDGSGVRGSLIVHDLDAAHDLGIEPAERLLDPTVAESYRARLQDLLGERLRLAADGAPRLIAWTGLEVVPERFGLKLSFTLGPRPARLDIQAVLFPYDPIHQTFVNIYEDGALRQQSILTADDPAVRFFAGTTQGRWSVVRTFVASGIEHILIGPDHVLFLIALLLTGGTIRRLALIVTAFTIGHSITLSLAALDVFAPPARIIEPLIALTIVVVGTDNLFVIQDRRRASAGAPSAAPRDARPLFAGFFGLVHGFGFASVLKEFGLPAEALVWSLVSFNVGVEIGQLLIVGVSATILAMVVRARPALADPLARWGSVGVILAGTVLVRGPAVRDRRRSMTRLGALGIITVAGAFAVAAAPYAAEQQPAAGPNVAQIEKVKDNLFMITGGGGNTAAFITANGVVLVDTKLANWGQAILDKVKTVTDKPVTHIINTHTHGDHVGSNEFFPASVEIVAQENTAANMKRMDAFKDPGKAHGLADKTFGDKMTVLGGNEAIDLYYFGPAHTNGDIFIVFRNLRVMHAGDAFSGLTMPIMDVNNGGSGVAYPETLAKAAAGIKGVETVIPGHSAVTNWQGFLEYGEFMKSWVGSVSAAAKSGKTADQAVAEFTPAEKFKGYNTQRAKANVDVIYKEVGR